MDLNYLYYRQQVALFMADNAPSGEARHAHRGMAEQYSKRIAAARVPVRSPAG